MMYINGLSKDESLGKYFDKNDVDTNLLMKINNLLFNCADNLINETFCYDSQHYEIHNVQYSLRY